MKLTQKLRKSMSTGIFAAILFSISSLYATSPEVLHQTQNAQTITKGATYITDSRLTSKGWQDLHILKVDLEDPNIQVRPIESSNIGEKQTVLSLVEAAGAVAGVNADFFDMGKQIAPSFGLVVEDGKINHAYNDKIVGLGASKDMGTMLIGTDKSLLLGYFSVDLTIQDPMTGIILATISSVNKPTGNLGTPVYLDRNYGPTTAPLESADKPLYKVVVENSVITNIIEPGQVANIPQDGYVLIMDVAGFMSREGSFSVGREIVFKSKLSLGSQFQKEIEEVEAGIGGGGLIMKDGAAYTGASHKVSPASREPRTVIGSSQDGKTLFLVTIDGRGDSIGATHNELVPILKSYGIYNAMHLDGGGSTTFVSREEGSSKVDVKNNPSGGSQRKVTNGVGVFSTSSPGQLSKIIISSTYDRTFIGTPISYTIKGVDENNNPVSIPKEQLSWSSEGVQGEWKNNSFYPSSSGSGLVIATVGSVEVAKPVTVSTNPIGIHITPAISVIKVGESTNMSIFGIDAAGYRAPIAHDQITWEVSSGAASVSQGKITGVKNGQVIINASLKNAPTVKTKISAVIGPRTVAVDSLDTETPGIWDGSNSASVTGRVERSKDLKYHGESSLKFIYSLAKTPNKQVAYMKLSSPIKIDTTVQSIGMWVYGNAQGDMFKIELADSNGKKTAIQVGEINFKGWKYLSFPVPNSITTAVNLGRMYTITTNNTVERTSSLYVDHISVTYGTRDKDASYLKAHEKFDPMHKKASTEANKGAYEFTLFGSTSINTYWLDNNTRTKIVNSMQKNSKFTILTGSTDSAIKSLIGPNTTWENKLNTYTYENTQVIHIGTSSGGLVKTDASQWTGFKNALENSKSDHIIITLNKDPFSETGFTDSREGMLFHDVIKECREKTGKNIVVAIAGGYDTDVYIRDGIRYIYTNGLMTIDDNNNSVKKIRFRINGKDMSYSIEPVL
ncbi:MAG TPA: hypothetical protein GX707_06660 [Epulopiscium sp.]|nr:hypothetical protein [Candidatus Epulonipiscium sp.]